MCNAHNHPAGCTCGFGGGHRGRSPIPSSDHTAPSQSSCFADDFCRPTTCPHCPSQVWFIRHNGGSIYVDSLGPPWPIHACFKRDYSSSWPIRRLAKAGANLLQPRLGLITAARRILIRGDLELDLLLDNGKELRRSCQMPGPAKCFRGDLVMICLQPPFLHHPKHGVWFVRRID